MSNCQQVPGDVGLGMSWIIAEAPSLLLEFSSSNSLHATIIFYYVILVKRTISSIHVVNKHLLSVYFSMLTFGSEQNWLSPCYFSSTIPAPINIFKLIVKQLVTKYMCIYTYIHTYGKCITETSDTDFLLIYYNQNEDTKE